jgi:hypothetical protein
VIRLLVLLVGGAAAVAALPVVVIVLVVSLAVSTASSCAVGGGLAADAPVPQQARAWVDLAQQSCPELPQAWIAAVMAQESSFRPDAYADDINGGTWGLLQISQPVWQAAYGGGWSTDRNGNGVWDIKEPEIHARVGGEYLCDRLETVRAIRADNPDAAATRQLTELEALVVAHNAGEGTLGRYPALPAITSRYVQAVRERLVDWAAPDEGVCVPAATIGIPLDAGSEVAQMVRTARAYVGLRSGWENMCDRLACRLYGYGNSGYPTAYAHWTYLRGSGQAHPGHRCPPVGAFMFWTSSSPAGHVATVVGNDGTCRPEGIQLVTNDWGDARTGSWGGVYLVTLAQIEDGWMARGNYLGWGDPVCLGARLPAGTQHPAP